MFEFECFKSPMSPRMRKLIRNVSIKIPCSNVLRIPGLIREFKHSNSNMRHWRLTSKGSLFFGTPCICNIHLLLILLSIKSEKPTFGDLIKILYCIVYDVLYEQTYIPCTAVYILSTEIQKCTRSGVIHKLCQCYLLIPRKERNYS